MHMVHVFFWGGVGVNLRGTVCHRRELPYQRHMLWACEDSIVSFVTRVRFVKKKTFVTTEPSPA